MQGPLVFGLVRAASTNCYHTLPCLHSESPPVCDLYHPPPPARHTDRHIEHTRIEHSRTWAHYIKVSSVAQHSTVGTARTIWGGRHGGTRHTGRRHWKEKKEKPDHGRTAFYEHGGRTGMAMLKYPRIQKNAQRYITHPMPASGPCPV